MRGGASGTAVLTRRDNDSEGKMKTQHKMATIMLGGILLVLAVFLLIAFINGDETNANNNPGGGVNHGGPP
jgi:uncharacterized membrane protein